MNSTELAKLLIESSPKRRLSLLKGHEPFRAVEISEALQTLCYEVWTDDPQKVSAIAGTLELLAQYTKDPEVEAYSEWTRAIDALVEGDLENCIRHLESSEAIFLRIDREHLAAKTQTSKLYALALLGRYGEAVECGIRARRIFIAHDDFYSAGKIEHNIGNLFWRRDRYRESEPYLESAHARFEQIDDQRQLAMVENCQAFVKTLQNDFRDAEAIYGRALERARENNLLVTAAEIETGLSNLYLFQGKYDLALKFMELSRQKYEHLDMPNQSANCELEIADIYLELNLLPEAVSFYRRVEERFEKLGLQAEHARCSLGHARALFRLDELDEAARELKIAEDLYRKEGNLVAVGSVNLTRSQLHFKAGILDEAEREVILALTAFENGQNIRLGILARWLRGEIWCSLGRVDEAEVELNQIISIAKKTHSKEVEYLCRVSLGKITGDEAHFDAAVELVEDSRVTLASEELRTSYFADKVVPYNELVKKNLARGQFDDAFLWHERSRSRSMVESLAGTGVNPHSDQKIRTIREELNWYHNRLSRNGHSTDAERKTGKDLKKAAAELEKEYAEMLRRLHSGGDRVSAGTWSINIDEFRSRLGDAALVEFISIDGRITAFVISGDRFTALPNYLDESEIECEIKQFLFQLRTGRVIDRLSPQNRRPALDRLQTHSRRIYDLVLGPLREYLPGKRIVFAPAGPLHNLPFHALHDGNGFLIERYEVSYTPSSKVLDNCLKKPFAGYGRALIAGVADELTPMVETEIECVSQFFDDPVRLFGGELTVAELRRHSAGKEVVHLACHGNFRADNPGFSSLSLFAAELTVNEAQYLQLENCIIVLSSCESGLNEVVRGEELIGLTRAFFAAGAATLVQSLWRVNDRATLEMMRVFYEGLSGGDTPSDAIRRSQLRLIDQEMHPYFWSPFIVSGRW